VWAIVVAGGSGARFGGPKQFSLLAGVPVVEWSIRAARSVAESVVLVVPVGHEGGAFGADVVVTGGPDRSSSVRRGLEAVPEDVTRVVIHDAARPLASPGLFVAVLGAVVGDVGGAVCAVPVTDTLKVVDSPGGAVVATVDRTSLVAVQTPQAFRTGVLRQAHADNAVATDDAALVESLGATVRVVPGDRRNVKLTGPEDLAYAELLVGR
jgi:2-C-methyl-D-erythritol 4-phosphate cytidylyltransferase